MVQGLLHSCIRDLTYSLFQRKRERFSLFRVFFLVQEPRECSLYASVRRIFFLKAFFRNRQFDVSFQTKPAWVGRWLAEGLVRFLTCQQLDF